MGKISDIIRITVGAAPDSAAQLKSDLDSIAKGLEIKVKIGIDKSGDLSGITKEIDVLDKKIKSLSTEGKKIPISFDTKGADALSKQNAELKKMGEYYKQLEKEKTKELFVTEAGTDISKQATQLENINQKYRELKSVGIDATSSVNELNQAFSQLQGAQTIDEYNTSLAQFDAQINVVKQDFKDLIPANVFDVKILSNEVVDWMNKNKRATKEFSDELKHPEANLVKLQQLLSGDVVSKGDLTASTKMLASIKTETKAMGIEGESAGEKFGKMFAKFGQWASITAIIMQIVNVTKQMVSTIVELDNQMNNIRMITGATSDEANKMLGTYQQLASGIASTTSEVLTSADAFLRQGRSVADTNELIKTSQILSKVGMMDSAQAAELLTSSINGYQISAQEAISVVDKMTAIDAAAATSTQELAKALSETATSAQLAGLSIDEILSYIATVSDVTRDSAESIKLSVA